MNSTISCASVLACTLTCASVLNVSAASAATETVLYSFNGHSDGEYPAAGLVDVGGVLYGTTARGGGDGCPTPPNRVRGCGTVFSIDPNTGTESVLYAFHGGNDGAYPQAALINVQGTLYGTTFAGGVNCGHEGCGTVFAIDPITRTETVIYTFKGGRDGHHPTAALIELNGTLFGTTTGVGTVFSITPSGDEKVRYRFQDGNDGAGPVANLINANGVLYGTTQAGGSDCSLQDHSCGTVFSITPSGDEKVLYSFLGGNDGAEPWAGLINVGGVLFGTTLQGGTETCGFYYQGCGTIFSVTLGGIETVQHVFRASMANDGANPGANLIDFKGTLYGTTVFGGSGHCKYSAGGCGTVFSITP